MGNRGYAYPSYKISVGILGGSSQLASPPFISHEKAIWKGDNQMFRGLTIVIVINHLLSGMILQVHSCKLRCVLCLVGDSLPFDSESPQLHTSATYLCTFSKHRTRKSEQSNILLMEEHATVAMDIRIIFQCCS